MRRLHEGEPRFGGGRVVALRALVADLLARRAVGRSGPFVLAVDGRSANGKSTLAGRISTVIEGAAVVHTDDVAWWHSRFGWDDLLVDGILEPLRRGSAVSYRPPGWAPRGREGTIDVAAGAPLVVVEGVGSARRSLRPWLDAVIWVQSDLTVAEARDAARVAAGETTPSGLAGWMAEEVPFQAEERTWEVADVVVDGTPAIDHDPDTEVVVLHQSSNDAT